MKLSHLNAKGLAAGSKSTASRCAICHRYLILRRLTTGKTRIRMHGGFCCSGSCFALAVEAELTRLITLAIVQPEHVARMSLAQILISRGSLTKEQFRRALDEQKESGGEIGVVLVGLGYINEAQLTAVRAIQWACPVFSPANQVNLSNLQIPEPLVRLYSVIPLHYTLARNLLLVGFVHSVEYGLLYLIEQMTGYKTEPCFISYADFQARTQESRLLHERSGDSNAHGVVFDDAKTPAEMARVLCASGAEGKLEEALIGRCKDHIWARLKSGSKNMDFLFNAV